MVKDFILNLKKEIKDWNKLLNKNRIFFDRNNGIGPITAEKAISLGLTGASLRATGIAYDVRKFAPYLQYENVEFEIPTRLEGDNLARYYVRIEEMTQAIRIIEQCLEKLPKGPIRVDDAKKTYPSKDEVYYSMEGLIHDFMMTDTGVCPPEGAACYHGIEASKGELGYYIESDGTGHPWRVKIKSPSLGNLQVLEHILDGQMVADTVVLIGGLDPVMGDADK